MEWGYPPAPQVLLQFWQNVENSFLAQNFLKRPIFLKSGMYGLKIAGMKPEEKVLLKILHSDGAIIFEEIFSNFLSIFRISRPGVLSSFSNSTSTDFGLKFVKLKLWSDSGPFQGGGCSLSGKSLLISAGTLTKYALK